jgi:hypothetical protein
MTMTVFFVLVYVVPPKMTCSIMESVPAEIEEDQQFSVKMSSLSFVTFAHLDVPAFYLEHEPTLGPAQKGMLLMPFSLRVASVQYPCAIYTRTVIHVVFCYPVILRYRITQNGGRSCSARQIDLPVELL